MAGLDEGISHLHVGDNANIICLPRKAFGDSGYPPLVPPNSHVILEVQVLSASPTESLGGEIQSAIGSSELICNISVSTINRFQTTCSSSLSEDLLATRRIFGKDKNDSIQQKQQHSDTRRQRSGSGEISEDMMLKAIAGSSFS